MPPQPGPRTFFRCVLHRESRSDISLAAMPRRKPRLLLPRAPLTRIVSAFLPVLMLSIGCGGDGDTRPPSDQTPPNAVRNLVVTSAGENEVTLRWASPGDDDIAGTAFRYDIRYSATPIDEKNFLAGTAATTPPSPLFSGTTQTHVVTGLERGRWYFALRSADEVANWSALSNVVSVSIGDSLTPSAVTDLVASSLDEATVELRWTAPGDDGDVGTCERYEVRYSAEPMSAENWEAASLIVDPPGPSSSGALETLLTSSLSRDVTYYFALKSVDDAGNWSDLSNIASATTRADTIAPAAAADFAVDSFTGRTATLTWTSPGDDGMDGVARAFDLRYSENEITAENFEDAIVVPDVAAPGQPGQAISATVFGLEPLSEYYFALRTADEAPNWSSLSPVVRIETSSSWQLTFSAEGETATDPDWSPDESMIVFVGTRNGQADLFLIPAEGGNEIQLTDTPQSEYEPVWSPDGTHIAFYYFLDTPDPYIGELYVMDAVPGSKATRLARHEWGVGAPCWSPESDAIAYQDQPLASIVTESTIYSVSVDGGDPRVLVNHGSDWGNHSPAWSPDGTRMVIMSTRQFDWNLWIVPLAGGEWTKLTELPVSVFHTDPAWSPDGSEIVYGAVRGGDWQIFRIPASGGPAEELTDASANCFRPRWSHDGSRIAYGSSRSGRAEVWIQIVE